MLVQDCAICSVFSNESHPAAVRTSGDWFLSCQSACLLTSWPALGPILYVVIILSVIVPLQFGSLCIFLCNNNNKKTASCSFQCSLHHTQSSALYYIQMHALQEPNAIYSPSPQGQIRLLFKKNKCTFSLSYLGRSLPAILKDKGAEGRRKEGKEEITGSESKKE